jgi:large subunit ribosomal protein L3
MEVRGENELAVGDTVTVDAFAVGDRVKVTGVSKGKGFQGVMKRHGFGGGPSYHGAHFHRAPGSIGASADPARVFPGSRLPGQMGNVRVTQTGLTVVATDPDKNLVLVKGAIPGSKGSLVVIRG